MLRKSLAIPKDYQKIPWQVLIVYLDETFLVSIVLQHDKLMAPFFFFKAYVCKKTAKLLQYSIVL